MMVLETERDLKCLQSASRHLHISLSANGSNPGKDAEDGLAAAHRIMVQMLSGYSGHPIYHLSALDPGSGKTEALCAFLRGWKDDGFVPAGGALVVLSTRKEILSCVERSGLQPCDFAVIVQKDHDLNNLGSPLHDSAPVIFTTHEKLRRLCVGRTFAEVSSLHYRGKPRRLRVWDEAFLPSSPSVIRKDTIVAPMEELRPVAPLVVTSLESVSDSLSDDTAGKVVRVPSAAESAYAGLCGHYGAIRAERWSALSGLAGRDAVVVKDGSKGLCLAGGVMSLPADFAPALILDASGRVRESYRTMEATGILQRLPSAAMDYSRLRIHHWDRAASRSTLEQPGARQEVLTAAADVINSTGDEEPWLVIHAKDRPSAASSIVQDLAALAANPARLSFLHWGNHHGTNDYRDIRRVMVLGLWNQPGPAYSALHVASGGEMSLATDKATLSAIQAGEHRHNLLQAICRASARKGTDGVCGDCDVWIVGKLGGEGETLLFDTFPGAVVAEWKPDGETLRGSPLRVAQAIETALAVPGVRQVSKGAVRASVGIRTGEGLAKVLRGEAFRRWAGNRGVKVTMRGFELRLA